MIEVGNGDEYSCAGERVWISVFSSALLAFEPRLLTGFVANFLPVSRVSFFFDRHNPGFYCFCAPFSIVF